MLLLEDADDEIEEAIEEVVRGLFPAPWYKRLWYWLTRRQPEYTISEAEELLLEDEFNKRVAVADCVETGLASSVWSNRALEGSRYYVVGMALRDMGDEFQLYVKVQPVDDRQIFLLPLHEFLEQCHPVRDLTFKDFHA